MEGRPGGPRRMQGAVKAPGGPGQGGVGRRTRGCSPGAAASGGRRRAAGRRTHPDALEPALADAQPVAVVARAALEKVRHQVGGLTIRSDLKRSAASGQAGAPGGTQGRSEAPRKGRARAAAAAGQRRGAAGRPGCGLGRGEGLHWQRVVIVRMHP